MHPCVHTMLGLLLYILLWICAPRWCPEEAQAYTILEGEARLDVCQGERDYYVNGLTGDRTFEKPDELMTEEELNAKKNFEAHRQAAESYVKRIDELQHDVETLKYERALAIMNGRPTAMAKKTGESKKVDKDAVDLKKMASGGFFSSLFGGGTEQAQYRSKLMAPDERKRGKNRSDYVKGILENVKPPEDD